MIPATNDVGLITLPAGRRLALAVFVIDSHADQATAERVIAEISRAVYDAAMATFALLTTGFPPNVLHCARIAARLCRV